jgi:hypothetical protein
VDSRGSGDSCGAIVHRVIIGPLIWDKSLIWEVLTDVGFAHNPVKRHKPGSFHTL